MPTVQMLSERDKAKIRNKLEEFYTLDESGDLVQYLSELHIVDGDVEIRFFPTREVSSDLGIAFEVIIDSEASWYEEQLGIHSADNLRNGLPQHQALAEELESIVKNVTGESIEFVKGKGGRAFTGEIAF